MHHRCVFALRESPVSATLGAQAVVAGSDPQKTGTGDVTIAGLQSAAGMSGNKMRFRLHWGHRSPGSRRIQESSRDTSSNKKYQCSSNTPQKGCNKRGAHEHVARLGRVVTNVEPSHWRLVGDDGLVLVAVVGKHGGNVPETLIDPVGLQKFGGRSAEHVALVGGAKDKLFEVEVVFEICDNRHSKTMKKSPTDK